MQKQKQPQIVFALRRSRYSRFAIRDTFQSRPDPPGCRRSRRAPRHSRSPRSLGVSQMWRLHFGSLHVRAVGARRLSALHRTLMELQIKQLSVKKKKKKEKRPLPGRLFSTPLFQSSNTKLLFQASNKTRAPLCQGRVRAGRRVCLPGRLAGSRRTTFEHPDTDTRTPPSGIVCSSLAKEKKNPKRIGPSFTSHV